MQQQQQVTDLDEVSDFLGLGLTFRQIFDWETRHRSHCKTLHQQPCNCSAWNQEESQN